MRVIEKILATKDRQVVARAAGDAAGARRLEEEEEALRVELDDLRRQTTGRRQDLIALNLT